MTFEAAPREPAPQIKALRGAESRANQFAFEFLQRGLPFAPIITAVVQTGGLAMPDRSSFARRLIDERHLQLAPDAADFVAVGRTPLEPNVAHCPTPDRLARLQPLARSNRSSACGRGVAALVQSRAFRFLSSDKSSTERVVA